VITGKEIGNSFGFIDNLFANINCFFLSFFHNLLRGFNSFLCHYHWSFSNFLCYSAIHARRGRTILVSQGNVCRVRLVGSRRRMP